MSKDNQAFLHARFDLGLDQLRPYKATISRWINPDLMQNQAVSVSKAKKAIANYRNAIGRPEGLAELSVFFCEEAFSSVEPCSFGDERYFVALIRMYDRCVNFVLRLPLAQRRAYVERLGKLRSRAKHVGWGVEDELVGMMPISTSSGKNYDTLHVRTRWRRHNQPRGPSPSVAEPRRPLLLAVLLCVLKT